MSLIINKPWGKEILYTNNKTPYTGKILILNQGQRTSLQKHDQKTETLMLLNGNCKITIENITYNMEIGKGYYILNNVIHRIICLKKSVIAEVSTPEIGTTFRIEDDYSRKNETLSDNQEKYE